MNKLSSKEAAEIERIYAKHKSAAYGVALKLLKEPHLAEDCAHDVMEKYAICLREGKLPTLESEKAFIITMAKNRALDILRKRSHEEPKGFGLNPAQRADETSPEQYITMDEYGFSEEVSARLQNVKDIDRMILFCHYKCDMDYKEIGMRIGRDANYVAQRVFQLKKRCRKEGQEDERER